MFIILGKLHNIGGPVFSLGPTSADLNVLSMGGAGSWNGTTVDNEGPLYKLLLLFVGMCQKRENVLGLENYSCSW